MDDEWTTRDIGVMGERDGWVGVVLTGMNGYCHGLRLGTGLGIESFQHLSLLGRTLV